jgi:hypothetical protein
MIDLLVIGPSPHLKAPSCPFTFEVLRAKECTPTPHPFVVFTLYSQLSLSRSLDVRHSFFALESLVCLSLFGEKNQIRIGCMMTNLFIIVEKLFAT